MRDFTYTNYIPDLTERYPEGFRTFDEPYDYGYEPSYEELVADGYENEMEDDYMTNRNAIINNGWVYGMYAWGRIIIDYATDKHYFFDNDFNVICILDDDKWNIHDDVLYGDVFTYELSDGVLLGRDNIDYIYRRDNERLIIYAKNTMAAIIKDGVIIEVIADPVVSDISVGFSLMPEEEYQANIDDFNSMIIRQDLHKHIV